MALAKKGQITVFIILGIVLIISVFFFFFIREKTATFTPDIIVPPEVAPVKKYVDACVTDVAENGLNIMGMQGGFIDLPDKIARNPASYLSVDPYAIIRIPYWQYKTEYRMPSLEYMRQDLEDYINSNITSCATRLDVFGDDFDIKAGKFETKVNFLDNEVVVEFKYPLSIVEKKGGKKVELENFLIRVPVRIKRVYELANLTMTAENDYAYFENITIDLMSIDPEFPFTGLEFGCEPKRWYVQDLKEKLQLMLFYHVPSIRIENTDYAPFNNPREDYEYFRKYTTEKVIEGDLPKRQPPEDAYEYFHMLLDVQNKDPTLKMKFVYQPEWGMDFMAYPSSGGRLSSRTMKGVSKYLSFMCINTYHYTYDIAYPVEAMIYDPLSMEGRGYTFKFAFPVMISENAPNRAGIFWRSFDGADYDTEFCYSETGDKQYRLIAKGMHNGFDNMEIPGVNLSYICVNKRCSLGTTDVTDGRYMLKTYMPLACGNPTIVAEKEGYLESRAQLDSSEDELEIPMKKLKRLKFEVVKHKYNAYTGQIEGITDLRENDSITIAISLVNTSIDFSQYIQYPYSDEMPYYVDLVEEGGQYSIDMILTTYGEPSGGYSNENIRITGKELATAKKIVFHVFEYIPNPMTEQEQGTMINYLIEGSYKEQLKPTFG